MGEESQNMGWRVGNKRGGQERKQMRGMRNNVKGERRTGRRKTIFLRKDLMRELLPPGGQCTGDFAA